MSLAFSFTFLDFLVFKHAECRLKRFKRPAAVKKIDYNYRIKLKYLRTQYPSVFLDIIERGNLTYDTLIAVRNILKYRDTARSGQIST